MIPFGAGRGSWWASIWEIPVDIMRVHAAREGNTIMVGSVDIAGTVWDIYDWRFDTHRQPAVLQVGYEPQCGRTAAGKVFGHYTLLARDGLDPGITITIPEP